jgi:hypothetical protein
MASLDSYIAELTFFSDNLHNIVGDAGVKHADEIIVTQNLRLHNAGKDSKNNLIGNYSNLYIESNKKPKGHRYDHVTLSDDGGWYSNMFVDNRGTKGLFIDNKDTVLTNKLMNGGGGIWPDANPPYGQNIVGLTEPETDGLVAKVIEPELQKIINKLPGIIDI